MADGVAPQETRPRAAQFAIEIHDKARTGSNNPWHRCKTQQRQSKFAVGVIDPRVVALDNWGPGKYRPVFYDAEGNKLGYGPDFDVGRPGDAADPVAGAPAPAPKPNGKNGQNGHSPAEPAGAFGMSPEALMNPAAQFALVYQMVSNTMAMQFQAIERAHAAQLASERTRSDQFLAMTRDFFTQVRKLETEAREAIAIAQAKGESSPELRAVEDQLRQMREELEDLADDQGGDDEGGADPQRALMALSQSPTDVERITVGLVNAINALASSPLGAAVAEGLKKRLVGSIAGEPEEPTE